LYIPVLIFGAGAVEAMAEGTAASGHLSLLGALFCLALVLGPWASAAAVRVALE
jgi:heme exporter protein B